jgi:membrane protein implicated in regulation of membrane protease activity
VSPWIALVLLSVAVALAVLEAAIPGLGLAGIGATVLGVGAGVVVWQAEVPWWPLIAVGAATGLWTLMLGWSRPPAWAQVVAATLHAAGGVTFGLLADDVASIAVAVVAASALAVAFPGLHGWTRKLVEQPPLTGMESLVGRTAVVQAWSGGRPVVRLDGSLWSVAPSTAPGPPLEVGGPVVVRGWRGVVLAVEPAGPPAEVPSTPS